MKIKKEQRQRQQNKKYRTLIRNSFKDVEKIASNKDLDNKTFEKGSKDLELASRKAQKIVDKASQKGLIHKKNAARKVRRIFNAVNLFKEKAVS